MAVRFIGSFSPKGKLRIYSVPPPPVIPPEIGDNAPVMVTDDGLLGVYDELEHVNLQIEVTDPDDDIRTYQVLSGTLPPGLTLNYTSGLISGDIGNISQDTEYSFTIRVTDSKGNSVTGDFSMMVRDTGSKVTWVTPSDLGASNAGQNYSTKLEATSS